METSFNKQLHDVDVSLEGRPVKRVRSYFFGASHDYSSVLWLDFEILLGSSLGDQQFH